METINTVSADVVNHHIIRYVRIFKLEQELDMRIARNRKEYNSFTAHDCRDFVIDKHKLDYNDPYIDNFIDRCLNFYDMCEDCEKKADDLQYDEYIIGRIKDRLNYLKYGKKEPNFGNILDTDFDSD